MSINFNGHIQHITENTRFKYISKTMEVWYLYHRKTTHFMHSIYIFVIMGMTVQERWCLKLIFQTRSIRMYCQRILKLYFMERKVSFYSVMLFRVNQLLFEVCKIVIFRFVFKLIFMFCLNYKIKVVIKERHFKLILAYPDKKLGSRSFDKNITHIGHI